MLRACRKGRVQNEYDVRLCMLEGLVLRHENQYSIRKCFSIVPQIELLDVSVYKSLTVFRRSRLSFEDGQRTLIETLN